jgi:hypothetical protein
MPICDGCGAAVEPEHIRQRIERLELATRYRPVHIQTLLIGDAPPERPEDYLYESERDAAELQRNGIFLVYGVECPLPAGANTREALRQAAATLAKRVRLSYKPRSIVLFSPATSELIPALRDAGFGEQLVLKDGIPFDSLPEITRVRPATAP